MLRIEPGLPLAWTSPTTVRIGIQRAIAIVEDVDDDTAELLDRLRRGVVDTEPAVMLGQERAARLLETIAPALEQVSRPRLRLQVSGVGQIAETVRALLAQDGHVVTDRRPELAVAIADWRLPEPHRQRLLHRDLRHLCVTIGDQRIDVGPYTVPGTSACSRCAALADPEGFVPLSLPVRLTPPATAVAQAVAATMTLVQRIATDRLRPGHGQRIDVRSGDVRAARWRCVAACGCRALPGIATASAAAVQRRARATGAASDAPS